MNKYIIGPNLPKKIQQAGAKFPMDVMNVASALGYEIININEWYCIKRGFKVILDFFKLMFIKKKSIVIYIDRIDKSFSRKMVFWILRKKNAVIISLVEDIDILRNETEEKIFDREISRLGFAQVIISQNQVMSEWIAKYLKNNQIINLNILDFISKQVGIQNHSEKEWIVTYGGNLTFAQSGFIYKLPDFRGLKFYVYGVNLKSDELPDNVSYKGNFEANECVNKLEGDWGLVWNGETLDIDEDNFKSRYYNYVCPHKLSMYLLCGMPVIVYEKSAMAKYVIDHDCGIVIKNVNQIPDELSQISDERYNSILKNVYKISRELADGTNLKIAINKAEQRILKVSENS